LSLLVRLGYDNLKTQCTSAETAGQTKEELLLLFDTPL
jgi:hypothetical protein